MSGEALERKRNWAAQCGMMDLEGYLAELQRARGELAELRAALTATYELHGIWPDGDEQPDVIPDRIRFVAEDGSPADFFVVDAQPLIDAVLQRQAKTWVEARSLGPELGAVLALVPASYRLSLSNDWPRPYEAVWDDDEGQEVAVAEGPTREAAILAATELLGLDEGSLRRRVAGSPAAVVKAAMAYADKYRRQRLLPGHAVEQALIDAVEQLRSATSNEERETCGSCALWCRDAEPATKGGARPCGLDDVPAPSPRHPASGCGWPGKYQRHPCVDCSGERCTYPWELFRCSACEQMVPFCRGAADDHPDLCDDCVAALPAADTDPAPGSDEPRSCDPSCPEHDTGIDPSDGIQKRIVGWRGGYPGKGSAKVPIYGEPVEQLPGVRRPASNVLRSEGDQTEGYRCSTCGEHVSPEIFVLLAGHCPSCGPTP